MKIIKNANLPDNMVKNVICGSTDDRITKSLNEFGIDVISLNKSEILDDKISAHADLQCIHLGENRILLSNEQKNAKEKLVSIGFDVAEFTLRGGEYPSDCAVNAAILGNKVICKRSITNPYLLDFIIENELEIIDVNQGYSRCSVCVVNENSIITEDESIKNACEKRDIDVLLIKKGYVSLDGFDYGFIGGASAKFSKNTLAFIGNIEKHPDFCSIKDSFRPVILVLR